MKKLLLLGIILVSFAACNSADTKAYQCPMKCEGEKTYAEDGKCPVCQMDLDEVKK